MRSPQPRLGQRRIRHDVQLLPRAGTYPRWYLFISWQRLPQGGKIPSEPVRADRAQSCRGSATKRKQHGGRNGRKAATKYFQAGVELVWIVDPPTRTIAVYTGPEQFSTLTRRSNSDWRQPFSPVSPCNCGIFFRDILKIREIANRSRAGQVFTNLTSQSTCGVPRTPLRVNHPTRISQNTFSGRRAGGILAIFAVFYDCDDQGQFDAFVL